jgi:hypothetical protein
MPMIILYSVIRTRRVTPEPPNSKYRAFHHMLYGSHRKLAGIYASFKNLLDLYVERIGYHHMNAPFALTDAAFALKDRGSKDLRIVAFILRIRCSRD